MRRRSAAEALLAPEHSPSLRAVPFGPTAESGAVRLLSRRHQQQLAAIASRVRLPRRKVIYREGTSADWAFLIGDGVVKAFRDLPDGTRRVASFLFPEDIFGLSERGLYVNSVQSVTPVTLYRIRFEVLVDALRNDAELDFQFLCKAANELREAQHHVIMVSRRDARGKIVMLLAMLEREAPSSEPGVISIPMTRSDMANYLGLSLEAVSRACRGLERDGIVDFTGRDRATVLDRERFDDLLAMR